MSQNELMDAKVHQIEKKLERILLQQKQVLDVKELISYTGFSKPFIYRLCSSNQIPFYKPRGKTIWFKREEIDEWLLRGKVLTIEEIEDQAISKIEKRRGGTK